MRILIGLPMYEGAHGLTLRSLLSLQKHLIANGYDVEFDIEAGSSNIPRTRNSILGRFISSERDVLLFIDSDMVFLPDDVTKLLNAPFDVSVINYRKKVVEKLWVCDPVLEDGCPVGETVGDDIWIQTLRAGTGLMTISREIALKVKDKYRHPFDYIPDGDDYPTEDYVFCDRVYDVGGSVYMLADAFAAHIGTASYAGNYHEFLTKGS